MKTKPDTVKLTSPKTWDELSLKQLLFVTTYFTKRIPEHIFLLKCLFYFTGIKLLKGMQYMQGQEFYKLKKGRVKFLLSADEITEMCSKLNWLLKDSTLTKNPFPKLKIMFKKVYGPADSLYNITLREFIYCEINFMSFCKSKHIVHLNHIISILYRPQIVPYMPNHHSYKGDRREPFNDHNFPKRAKRLIWLQLNKKLAIFAFYSGARAALQKEFPSVFLGENTTSKPKNMAKQMMDLVRAVNGGDPTKNETLLDLNVRDILGEMQTAHERVIEMQNNMNKSRRGRKQ